MDLITGICKEYVQNFNCDESLASMLRVKIDERPKQQPVPSNYYYLTHLCNPIQTFMTNFYPETKKSLILERKLNLGDQLHKRFGFQFRDFPGFMVKEGVVDGIWVGIKGVRGRIDYVMENSILELKTKEKLPNDAKEIFLLYPHDLEQLVFYSVLHPPHHKINYLIFMKDTHPFEIKAFKVITKDFGRIKTLFLSRIKMLNDAIKNKDPSHLGRCRYYEDNCEFKNSKICSCEKLESISTKQLEFATEITYDEEFTKKLEDFRKQHKTPNSFFSIRDIIAPRKYYLKTILKPESVTTFSDNLEYLAHLEYLISKLPLEFNTINKEKIKESLLEPRLYTAYKWMKFKSSMDTESEVAPYLIKVSPSINKNAINRPFDYYMAELGIISAAYGKTRGFIIVLYPNLDNFIQVFQVNYKKTNELLQKIKEIIDKTEKSITEKNILNIPPCPNFMNDEKKCPLMDECHSEKDSGCASDYIVPK